MKSHIEVIHAYPHAHNMFLEINDILDPLTISIAEAYTICIEHHPELARYSLYDAEAMDYVESVRDYETGARLESLYIWTLLAEEWWTRLGRAGSVSRHVVWWECVRAQTSRLHVVARCEKSKPWRRSKKGKIKRPVISVVCPAQLAAFH